MGIETRVQKLEEKLRPRDEGETEEDEHIASQVEKSTASERIDFREIIQGKELLSRKEIIQRCSRLRFDERTIDRLLNKAKAEGKLTVPKFGHYALPDFDSSTSP